MILLRLGEVQDDQQWDDLVRSSPAGTIFHTSLWSQSSPHNFARIGVYNGGELTAGAIIQVDARGAGTLGTLAPYLGPVFAGQGEKTGAAHNEKPARLLAQWIRESVPRAKFFVSPWLEGLQPFLLGGFKAQLLHTRVISLTDLDRAYAGFSPAMRRTINAAVRCKLLITRGQDSSHLMSLVRASFARAGRPLWFSVDEAECCMRHLSAKGNAAFIYASVEGGRPVAGVGIMWDGRRGYYILGGYDHTSPYRGGMALALWHAMRLVRLESGLMTFDLEGSHLPGVARFFTQFGGQWLPFYYITEGTLDFAG